MSEEEKAAAPAPAEEETKKEEEPPKKVEEAAEEESTATFEPVVSESSQDVTLPITKKLAESGPAVGLSTNSTCGTKRAEACPPMKHELDERSPREHSDCS